MFVCPFIHPPLVRLASLILFIVTCGHLELSVFLVTNTIWLYLMIALTTCGLFLCDSNLTLSVRLPTSSPTPPPNLAPTSRLSSATTGKSLTTLAPITSSSPRASIFVCPAPIPRLKMVKPNALFAPSIMSFAHCSFRRLCLPPTGRRPSPQRPFCLTYYPPRLYSSPRPTLPCTARRRRMITYESLAASVIQTYPPPLLINSLLGLPCASS